VTSSRTPRARSGSGSKLWQSQSEDSYNSASSLSSSKPKTIAKSKQKPTTPRSGARKVVAKAKHSDEEFHDDDGEPLKKQETLFYPQKAQKKGQQGAPKAPASAPSSVPSKPTKPKFRDEELNEVEIDRKIAAMEREEIARRRVEGKQLCPISHSLPQFTISIPVNLKAAKKKRKREEDDEADQEFKPQIIKKYACPRPSFSSLVCDGFVI